MVAPQPADEPARDLGETLRLPLLDGAAAADVHADDRPGRVAPARSAAASRADVVGKRERRLPCAAITAAERGRHQRAGIVGGVRRGIVVERPIERGAAAAARSSRR